MKKTSILIVTTMLICGLLINSASAIAGSTYNGIDFPYGDASFADEVVSYDLVGGASVGNPEDALGTPDRYDVSLGTNGYIVLKFNDNSLTTSGDSDPDLYVKEGGQSAETSTVFISTDGVNWIEVGVASGSNNRLFDIDSVPGVVPGTKYQYVKIVDLNGTPTSASWEGSDVESVGAITSSCPVTEDEKKRSEIPEFPTIALPMVAIIGLAFFFGRKN